MRRLAPAGLLLPGVLALGLATVADAQEASKAQAREVEQEERVERPVPFPEPAAQMRKLSFLVGTWELKETWEEPARYKRGRYEGYPGEEGFGEETIRQGPGGFSLLWSYGARNPMGSVTAEALLSWDPVRRVYEYCEAHSAFAGALRLTGRFEKGSLVFRGESARTGEKTSVRLVMKDLSTEGWMQILEESRKGGRMERVVTTVARRAAKK